MPWLKRDTWVPEDWLKDGADGYERLIQEDAAGNHPLLIVTFYGNIGLVHDDIDIEKPKYAVEIVRFGQPLYGRRVRGIQIRHAHVLNDRDRLWLLNAQCRIAPS